MSEENLNQNNINTTGIPSVVGKPAKQFNRVFLVAALAAIALVLVGVTLSFIKSKTKESLTKDNTTETLQTGSARGKYELTLPPLAAIDPREEKTEVKQAELPLPDVREEHKPLPEPEPVYTATALTPPPEPAQVVVTEKEKEPTLEEKRNAAPLMGEEQRDSSKGSGSGKGFAETLRDESVGANYSDGKLGGLMHSVYTAPTKAERMPNRNLLLAKGTFIDCVLETRLDTTVPGMTSCVVPRNIYSANGKVLLIERGSKAVGEYKGAVENGLNRIFVLWTQIQTPKGVRINLDSPGTDALGGAGLPGEVDFHWWARFGNALLFTLVQDAFEFGMTKQSENNGGVNYYQNSEDGMKDIIREAMRQSGNIPPTLTKNQGERIGIFVARDVDFSSVYSLKPIQRQTTSSQE